MYIISNEDPDEIEEKTFAELGKKENDIEELLPKNIDIICEDEESVLTVGQQATGS